jgi:hypothetical protein
MTEDDEDFTPWTAAGAERLRSAAAELSTALAAHAQAVTAVTGEAGSPQVLAANERLLPAVLAYADAQFDYTGNAFPFGVLHEYEEDDEDEEEDGEPLPADGISVLQRRDYAVTDEAAVMTAGRRAYLRVWPDDDEAAAAADVTHLGRAAYQLAHADGWESLDDVEGLERNPGRSARRPHRPTSALPRLCPLARDFDAAQESGTCTPPVARSSRALNVSIVRVWSLYGGGSVALAA